MNELISKTSTLLLLSTWLDIVIEFGARDRLLSHVDAHGVMAAAVKRNYLPLKKKVELIKHAQTHPSTNIRELAELFECGKTQVAQILKKEKLLAMYESNASGSRVHTASHHQNIQKSTRHYMNGIRLHALKTSIQEVCS